MPPSAPQSTTTAAFIQSDGKALATPAVRRIAREYNVDISQIVGTGKDGRVMKEDVQRFVASRSAPTQTSTATTASTTGVSPSPSISVSAPADRVEALRGFRRAMVKTMTQSLSIPHFGYCDEV